MVRENAGGMMGAVTIRKAIALAALSAALLFAVGSSGARAQPVQGGTAATQSPASRPGEAGVDLAAIGKQNYAVAGRQFADAGLNYETFDALRSHVLEGGARFTARDILDAAQDAKTQQFSPNSLAEIRSIALLNRYHPEGRDLRNRIGVAMREQFRNNGELRKIIELLKVAKTDRDRAQVQARIRIENEVATEQAIQAVAADICRGRGDSSAGCRTLWQDNGSKAMGRTAEPYNKATAAGAPPTSNTGPLPAVEDAGQVAADLCARRGDTSVNCIRLERNRIFAEIEARAKERLAAAEIESRCLDQLTAAKKKNAADFQAAKAAAGVTRIETDNACLVASKLPKSE